MNSGIRSLFTLGSIVENPKLVVSAVNLTEGGTLSILLDLAEQLERTFGSHHVHYLIHASVARHFVGRRYDVFSWPKRGWTRRIFFEKSFVKKLEKRLQPQLWISLHDITASLNTTPQILYCHNPSPFLSPSVRLPVADLRFFLFRRFYSLLYRWGIQRNLRVIVQQQWMREEFLARYPLSSKQIVVARPIKSAEATPEAKKAITFGRIATHRNPLRVVYPAFPRVFKNIEYVGQLALLLKSEPIQFAVTVNGDENRYAKFLKSQYGGLPNLSFLGQLPRSELFKVYHDADALIFPSHLETWGLPLSEFMLTGKPIFAADLPYAREVLSGYSNTKLMPLDRIDLTAESVRALSKGSFLPDSINVSIPPPFCEDWSAFAKMISGMLDHRGNTP